MLHSGYIHRSEGLANLCAVYESASNPKLPWSELVDVPSGWTGGRLICLIHFLDAQKIEPHEVTASMKQCLEAEGKRRRPERGEECSSKLPRSKLGWANPEIEG